MPSNWCESVSKPALSSILSVRVLEDILFSFESAFGLSGAVRVIDIIGTPLCGNSIPAREPDARADIIIDHEFVGSVAVFVEDQQHPANLMPAAQHLAVTLSNLATEIWRRNQFMDEIIERNDELNLIYGLGNSFVQGSTTDAIFRNVLDETRAIIRADSGVIYIWNSSQSNLAPISYFGSKSNSDFWSGRVRELALSTLYAFEQAQVFDNDQVICAPLRYNDEMLGSLVLVYEQSSKTFKAKDVNLLTALTHNTSLFIYAARLVERLAHEKEALEQTLVELKATQDKLNHAERLSIVGQTVSSLVHDMRKPLSNVMGYAGLLQEPDLTFDERQQFAGQIIKYIEVFSAMAQEVLDYTSGDESVRKSLVNVDEYMSYVTDLLAPPGLERTVKIISNYEAARGLRINIDSQRFTRVFQNLVNNAVDAIEGKGGTQVEIDVRPIGDQIRFSISDDGPGVPHEIIETLFEPFVTMGKSHGTGLGLAIVDRMVTVHGGKISYEDRPGGGACFTFSIPQAN